MQKIHYPNIEYPRGGGVFLFNSVLNFDIEYEKIDSLKKNVIIRNVEV